MIPSSSVNKIEAVCSKNKYTELHKIINWQDNCIVALRVIALTCWILVITLVISYVVCTLVVKSTSLDTIVKY